MTNDYLKFLELLLKVTKQDINSNLFYYPEKSISRIRNDQMNIFIDECIISGLLNKKADGFSLTHEGEIVTEHSELSMVEIPYKKALKKINKLYIDILI